MKKRKKGKHNNNMARMIDLDLVAREPIQIRLQGKTFVVNEPVLEQLIKRDKLLKDLELAEAGAEGRSEKDNRDLIDNFDYRLLSIFLPWLTDELYKSMTIGQKKGLYQLVFEGEMAEEATDKKKRGDKDKGQE